MSEEERSAKAARAKALLKKRQAKKSGVGTVPSAGLVSPAPSSPLSRAYSPAPSESHIPDEDRTDLEDVFGKASLGGGPSDASWLASLPRTGSPSISVSPPVASPPLQSFPPPPAALPPSPSALAPSPAPASPALSETPSPAETELHAQIQNQQQTISLLVSEKASLSASVERLAEIDTQAQMAARELEAERDACAGLRARVQQLEDVAASGAARIEVLAGREKELEDRAREQERELQLMQGSADEFRGEAERATRRVRELEDQIQSDDRVERLEASLQNVQDRASELEFQLSKLKQTHAALKSERDALAEDLRAKTESEMAWAAKHAVIEAQGADAQRQLATVTTERDVLAQEFSTLQAAANAAQDILGELQAAMAQSTTEAAATARQLQNAQMELRQAARRAEEAEKAQEELQAEGATLMRSLEEMRPKIVELTDLKLDLTEKTASLEAALADRDGVIAHLEGALHELRDQADNSAAALRAVEAAREADGRAARESTAELQRGLTELQAELDDTRAAVRSLENERAASHELVARHADELDAHGATTQSLKDELQALRHELEERRRADDEGHEFLERARGDVEMLQAELEAKDAELDELRGGGGAGGGALDREMLSALRQGHALELSAAQSQIRALQTGVFAADARAHALQKQVAALEDQLAQAHSQAPTPRPWSPDVPARPGSRAGSRPRVPSDDLRRASLKAHARPPALPSQAAFGENLSPETRHKRKVSLGMLKARIDSERLAAPRPLSRAVSPAPVPEVEEPVVVGKGVHAHGQFLDEAHVFWCHSCRGDLVVL